MDARDARISGRHNVPPIGSCRARVIVLTTKGGDLVRRAVAESAEINAAWHQALAQVGKDHLMHPDASSQAERHNQHGDQHTATGDRSNATWLRTNAGLPPAGREPATCWTRGRDRPAPAARPAAERDARRELIILALRGGVVRRRGRGGSRACAAIRVPCCGRVGRRRACRRRRAVRRRCCGLRAPERDRPDLAAKPGAPGLAVGAGAGFAAQRQRTRAATDVFRLGNCPYRGAVRVNQTVVCELHRGLTSACSTTSIPTSASKDFVAKDPDRAGCLIEVEGLNAASRPRSQRRACRGRSPS